MDAPDTATPGLAAALERAETAVTQLTRWCDDFPSPGVRFADLTPVFADGPGYRAVVEGLAAAGAGADIVAGVDARGFLLGGGVAMQLGCGVLAVRKAGKLPPPVYAESYSLEYGAATLEIPCDAPDLTGRRVFVIDDVLATGGTLLAAADLLTRAGADVVGVAVVLELAELGGRARFDRYPLTSLVRV
ncbi:adenine phosphoribosyltransferase [Rhodococcus sp. SGAir0479]|uniref:adenine phosphoribosyltransferase n=1 Tax=Rhodococcus sp. SGAir0479 TaxID=2567884 RepID=UPI0010CD28FD|nr:adenine phosphoribosyltransferase [Rhodococcus sp. SGAir0479]QCQ93797.1 adenine phosphoribosyltransferase [Rhodococcus sp. SGAir0479]